MIKYRSIRSYKYQLMETYTHSVDIKAELGNYWVYLLPSKELVMLKGYCWDGPSGPSIDTENFMRGSLVHDALYQLIRKHPETMRPYKDYADRLLQQICIEDGMSKARAWWVYQAVKYFGGNALRNGTENNSGGG